MPQRSVGSLQQRLWTVSDPPPEDLIPDNAQKGGKKQTGCTAKGGGRCNSHGGPFTLVPYCQSGPPGINHPYVKPLETLGLDTFVTRARSTWTLIWKYPHCSFAFYSPILTLVFNLPQTRQCDFTIRCKKCGENIPAPVGTLPDYWIAARCPLCGEKRSYLPSEIFRGNLSYKLGRKPVQRVVF